jgi:hypothetical protein
MGPDRVARSVATRQNGFYSGLALLRQSASKQIAPSPISFS